MFTKVDCQMEAKARIAIALLLVGCAQPQVLNETTEKITAIPTIPPQLAATTKKVPRRLKLRLTLDRPEDLKVKIGDQVVKGQIVSDRSAIRARLLWEQENLRHRLKQLHRSTIFFPYSVEKAEVEQARLKVEQARGAISAFHANSLWTDYARSVLPITDNIPLRELQNQYVQAKGELAIAVAKLHESQQKGIVLRHHSTQVVELKTKLQDIGEKLNTMGQVHSPINGCIKSIKWLGQTNRDLQIEVTVAVSSNFEISTVEPKSSECSFRQQRVKTTFYKKYYQ